MSKVPYVERPYGYTTGLTGECAYVWALFLMHEADWNEDNVAYDRWKSMVDDLAPKPNKPVPAAVHYVALEDAIEKYTQ